MDYTQIINSLITTSSITVVIYYLAKLIIDKFIESRFEKYKNTLQIDTEKFRQKLNLEAEKFKHNLNTNATEHQIRYSKLYEERGHVIKLIYNLLLDLENSLNNLTTISQGPDWTTDTERDKKTIESIQNLRDGLEHNRIFFTFTLCEKIDSIIVDSNKIRVEMNAAKIYKQRNEYNYKHNIPLNNEELDKPLNTWIALEQKVQNEIKAARLNLAQDFRVLIGVEQ